MGDEETTMGMDDESPTLILAREVVPRKLRAGPMSSRELGLSVETLRLLESEGTIAIDPDPWPDEYVPGNPLIARLPNDDRRWPGWDRWNV